jgi:hypothetical protein
VHWKRDSSDDDYDDDQSEDHVPGIGRTTISHSVLLIVVRMCHGSIQRMRFVKALCTPVLHI